jgi:phosphotriesterase-related protein
MKTIKTLRGEISPEQLGFVDIHDHLWKSGGMEVIEDKDFGIESIEKSRKELQSYVDAGGKTMVDMQPLGVGRGINELIAINEGIDANIIAITGFHRGKLYDKTHFVHKYSIEQLVDIIVSEVEKGIEVNDFCGPIVKHSGVKPGLVKAGTSYYIITPLEEKLLRVVARVSVKTGIPIKTHTHMGTMGLEQVRIFKEEGVQAEKICIGHLDRNADPVYHEMVLREGVFVQYDCVARVKYNPVSATMDLIKSMSDKGYGNRIMIGGDWGRASYLKAYNGAPGFEFIPKYLPSLMKEYGVDDETINNIFYENPKKFLAY